MIGTIKIDEIYETVITSLENEGKGVCKINGMVVFVPKTLVGEKVRIRITEIKKNFAVGKVVEILKESDKRVKSRCPYYEECGGCSLRHQTKEENLKFKKGKVQTALKRIGKIDVKVDDCVACFKDDHYRNKVSFKVEDDRIGFYAEGTYQLVDIKQCLLAENKINDCLGAIRNYIKENKNKIKSITIKHGNALDEVLIDIYSLSSEDAKIINYLTGIDGVKTIVFNDKVVYGTGYINQISNGLMFLCSSKSFFQVNDVQTEKLYKLVLDDAKLNKNDVVLDLYSGTGTISCIISSHVKKVIGIEIVEDAVLDARKNLKVNGINNVKFICGDAAKEISKIKEKIDVIIVDPPRRGVDRKAISIMKKILPKKIIYISCNPVTMARDLSYLTDLYDVKKVIPVDMFPNTSHVECVGLLCQKKSAKTIEK